MNNLQAMLYLTLTRMYNIYNNIPSTIMICVNKMSVIQLLSWNYTIHKKIQNKQHLLYIYIYIYNCYVISFHPLKYKITYMFISITLVYVIKQRVICNLGHFNKIDVKMICCSHTFHAFFLSNSRTQPCHKLRIFSVNVAGYNSQKYMY